MHRYFHTGALLLSLAPLAASAASTDYVGAARCGSCHAAALASWQTSAHAHASTAEVLGSRAGDGACLVCHATGGASRARLPGVQCEACHGAGAAYDEADLMLDRPLAVSLGLRDLSRDPAALCLRCHRSPGTRAGRFDYATAWAEIQHR
jgi:hypothetical protein